MPTLSVTEKNHWRDRIAARIDRAVDRIRAQHPALFERVKRDAHTQALASLNLTGAYTELEAILAEEVALARRKKQTQRTLVATLRGVPFEEVPDNFAPYYSSNLSLPNEVAEAITRRQSAHQEQLLSDDPVGRQVAGLQAEKDNLLDTIWLATSPGEVRTLWVKVAELLGDEATRLEREALAITPAEED